MTSICINIIFFLNLGYSHWSTQRQKASIHAYNAQRFGEFISQRESPGLLPPDPRSSAQLFEIQKPFLRTGQVPRFHGRDQQTRSASRASGRVGFLIRVCRVRERGPHRALRDSRTARRARHRRPRVTR